jgi:hypothetical protein
VRHKWVGSKPSDRSVGLDQAAEQRTHPGASAIGEHDIPNTRLASARSRAQSLPERACGLYSQSSRHYQRHANWRGAFVSYPREGGSSTRLAGLLVTAFLGWTRGSTHVTNGKGNLSGQTDKNLQWCCTGTVCGVPVSSVFVLRASARSPINDLM